MTTLWKLFVVGNSICMLLMLVALLITIKAYMKLEGRITSNEARIHLNESKLNKPRFP